MTRFMVFASMRSGSRWLVELLDAQPAAVMYSEAFRVDARGYMTSSAGRFPFFNTYVAARPSLARKTLRITRAAYLESLYRSGGHARAVGLKIMGGQVARNPGVLAYCTARRVRAVHMVRRNVLGAIVSHRVALERGVFHPRSHAELAPVRVQLDVDDLVSEIRRRSDAAEGIRVAVARHRLPAITVEYDDLVQDTQRELGRLCGFLRIPAPTSVPETTLVRATGPLEDVVSNLDAVRSALAGTSYAWMLGGAGEVAART